VLVATGRSAYPLGVAIRTRILLCMLLIVGTYTLAGVVVVHYSVRAYALRSTETLLLDRIVITAEQLDANLDDLGSVTRGAARAEYLAPFLQGESDTVEMAGEALAWIGKHTRADALFLLDPDGNIALQSGDAMRVPGDVVQHPTIRGALERGVGAWWLPLEGHPYLAALAPVNDGDERVGLLLAVVAFEIEELGVIAETAGAQVVLLEESGALLHTLGRRAEDDSEAAASFELLARRSPGERLPHQMALFGARYLVIERALKNHSGDDIGVALLTPLATITEMARGVRQRLGMVGLIVTALSVLLALLLSRTISRPLEDLVAYARRAAEGDTRPASSNSPLPEMVVLADALGDLVRQQTRRRARAKDRARAAREQEIGLALQSQLEAADVETPGFDTAVGTWRHDEAAGDVVEVLPADDGGLWIAVGEVASRGVRAAAIAAMLRGAVASAVALQPAGSPSLTLAAVNRALSERIRRAGWEPCFAALRLLRLAPDGTLAYAGAQQEMLLIAAGGGTVRRLTWHGTWLGLGPGALADDPDGIDTLRPGDTLVLQTDGLLAGQDATGRLYGYNRVQQVLELSLGHPARVVRDRLMGSWDQWTETPLDDASVVVVRRHGGAGAGVHT